MWTLPFSVAIAIALVWGMMDVRMRLLEEGRSSKGRPSSKSREEYRDAVNKLCAGHGPAPPSKRQFNAHF